MATVTDTSFPARLTTTKNLLTNTLPALFNTYQTQITNSESLINQRNSLNAQVKSLESKKKDIEKSSDTYHREFLDRTAGSSRGFFQRCGVSTFQDWLVLLFYLLYCIICISVFVIGVIASTQKILAGVIILIASIFLGLLITGIILRFG